MKIRKKMNRDDIQLLLEKYLDTRDDKDFAILYDRMYPRLIKHVYDTLKVSKISDAANIDDLMQDIQIKIITNIDSYNAAWSFSTWAFIIARNHVIAYKQKNYKTKYTEINFSDFISNDMDSAEDSTESKIFSKVDRSSNFHYCNLDDMIEKIENEYEKEKFYKDVVNSLYNLPEQYRDILVDREFYDMDYESLAVKYILPIQTIKNRIYLGRQKIKERHYAEYKEYKRL